MIKTRRPETDTNRSCAKCKHLVMIGCASTGYKYRCGIDGAEVPEPVVITMTTCDKWKEVGNGKL